MEVVGRTEEKKIFKDLIISDKSQFLAVYGRRRIGKTYLIRNAFEKNIVFELTGLHETNLHQQLENFNASFKNANYEIPKSWIQAFKQLGSHIDKIRNKTKKVIFIDEIPWIDTPKSGFLGAFANFWNNYCSKRTDVILVICGSATTWIINKIINDKGGLHNRLTRTIKLEPFTLAETHEFLKSKKIDLAPRDLAQLYMCIGGVPYYMSEIKRGLSLAQILDQLFFSSQAILKFEFENLYAALFLNHEKHLTVVKALTKKNSGLTRQEIINTSKIESGGAISTILEELETCGFIEKYKPIDKEKEDCIYRLMDEYTLFYYKFLHKKTQILNGQSLVNSQAFRIWSGIAFESLCMRHHQQIAKALGFSGILYNIYSFVAKTDTYKGAQIDLIFDRADNVINILEAKFHNDTYIMTKAEAQIIENKKNAYLNKTKSRKTIFTTLITLNGSEKNQHHLSVITNELQFQDLVN